MFGASKWVIRLGWLTVSAVLAVLTLSSIAAAVRTVVVDTAPPAAPGATPQPPALPSRSAQTAYAALRTSPVFGELAPLGLVAPPPLPIPVEEALPVTTLKLRLVGTVSGLAEDSLAIIENQSVREQKTYMLGDEVVEGATLEAVQAQRVVLLHDGRREVLEMLQFAVALPVGSTSGTPAQRAAPSRRGRGAGRRSAATPAGGAQPQGAVRRINDNLRVINREQFEQEIGADLLRTVTSVRTQPRLVGGTASGVTLMDTGRDETLTMLGFQEGDVLVSVNGQRINTDRDLALLAESLSTASDIRVQVIRGNLPRTLIYKVR